MKQILVYSDSLSWGIIPNTRERLPFNKRWPGVFESFLRYNTCKVRIIENCLNGRRTAWDDPFKRGRNATSDLAQAIEMHSPLELVIIMLGTNDFQNSHNNNAWLSAQGTNKLISIIKEAPVEPGMNIPQILVVSPPEILSPKGVISNKFAGAEIRSKGLAQELQRITLENNVFFFDVNSVTKASEIDGIHLDEKQHKVIGNELGAYVFEKTLVSQHEPTKRIKVN